jgi:hypothetical protein
MLAWGCSVVVELWPGLVLQPLWKWGKKNMKANFQKLIEMMVLTPQKG